MKSRVFPNGFIFTDKDAYKLDLPDYYETELIINDFTYSYDKHSNKKILIKQDRFIIIHGLFTHIDLKKGNITNESPELLLNLYFEDKEKFLDSLNFLGGRFVIIVGDAKDFEIYPDASAMRTVFYHKDINIICSHIKMLEENFSSELSVDPIYEIAEDVLKMWDTTQFNEVKSINPNFYYSTKSRTTERFFPRKINKYIGLSDKVKLETFEFLWKEQIKFFSEQYKKIIFSITGGADSRVSLALAKNHINSLNFFTYAPTVDVDKYNARFFKSLSKDKKIVDQILEVIPLNHQYLLFKDNSRKLTNMDTTILNRNTNLTHGRFLLPHYNYFFPEDNVLHIRGNLFEIGRAYYINKYSRNNKSDITRLMSAALLKLANSKNEQNVLTDYINDKIVKFNYDINNSDYHVLDLYYWEIRMGRWMAEVLNETDLSFETLLPFNMREIMDISLSYDIQERKNNFMFDEIINRNYPVLNFFGKNELSNIYEKNRAKLSEKNFDYIKVFKSNDDFMTKINNEKDEVFIPKEYLQKNFYAEITFNYALQLGNASIELQSEYRNDRAKDYLKYQILVNGEAKLEEDISLWNMKANIIITGLKKDDIINIRVISLKKSGTESWEKASKVKIFKYEELPFKGEIAQSVYSNSPFSINI